MTKLNKKQLERLLKYFNGDTFDFKDFTKDDLYELHKFYYDYIYSVQAYLTNSAYRRGIGINDYIKSLIDRAAIDEQ